MRGEEGALGCAGSHGQGFIIKASWERHRKASEKGKDKEILWNKNLVKVERRKERKDGREGGQEGGREEERRKERKKRKRKEHTSLASHLRKKAQTAELANQASRGHWAGTPLQPWPLCSPCCQHTASGWSLNPTDTSPHHRGLCTCSSPCCQACSLTSSTPVQKVTLSSALTWRPPTWNPTYRPYPFLCFIFLYSTQHLTHDTCYLYILFISWLLC